MGVSYCLPIPELPGFCIDSPGNPFILINTMLKAKSRYGLMCQTLLITTVVFGLVSCGGLRRSTETSETSPEESKDKKIENLNSSLSRAQSRIEELDAKLAALSDKVDATRLTVDNLSGGGGKPLKTEAVGMATSLDAEQAAPPVEAESSAKKAKAVNDKTLIRMDSAMNEFVKAMNLFKTGKYTDAELGFNHFTEQYPEHILAGSAQFYSGESYFMMNEFKLAINEYGKVVSSFTSSPRVASAMVRMAQCYEQSGNTGEASRTLALARDLYDGNPSLDWSGPGLSHKTEKVAKKSAELNSAPMEPEKAQHEKKTEEDSLH
jgi:tol-pal system protein YbgF